MTYTFVAATPTENSRGGGWETRIEWEDGKRGGKRPNNAPFFTTRYHHDQFSTAGSSGELTAGNGVAASSSHGG